MIDLTGGGRTEITDVPAGTDCAPVPAAAGALFGRADGRLLLVGRDGVRATTRLPTRVDRLVTGEGQAAYAIGKGHLTALTISASEA